MKITVTIILFLICSSAYSQSLSLDYKNVGDVNYHSSIILGHQFDGTSPMVSIYLWNLQSNETTHLLTEKWESNNWHYHSFNVSKYENGSYRFIVGFGKNTSKEIEFFVLNRK